jgi:hypothetical protein
VSVSGKRDRRSSRYGRLPVETSVAIFSKIAGPIPGIRRRLPSATAASTSPGKVESVRAALA